MCVLEGGDGMRVLCVCVCVRKGWGGRRRGGRGEVGLMSIISGDASYEMAATVPYVCVCGNG